MSFVVVNYESFLSLSFLVYKQGWLYLSFEDYIFMQDLEISSNKPGTLVISYSFSLVTCLTSF